MNTQIFKRKLTQALPVFLLLLFSTFFLNNLNAQKMKVKNVVLVHGAFADGSGWKGVYSILVKKGYHVVVLQEPMTSLEDDVKNLRHELDQLDGPCILVGHSYGGAVITEGGNHPKVAGLVYVAAFQPDKGESDLTLFQSAPVLPENAILPPDNAGVVYIDKAKYRSSFCADVPKEQADLMAASQGQFAGKAFATPITDPAWRHLPSYACIATEDKMINPVIQHRIYERSKSIVTEIKGSHCIFMSQPQAVTAWIIKAATELSAKN